MKDYYKILDVERNVDNKGLKKQYKKLAKLHHPDKNGGSKKSEDSFKEIGEAYDILSDSKLRQDYDLQFQKQQNLKNQTKYSSVNTPKPENNRKRNFRFWFAAIIIIILVYRFIIEESKNTDSQIDNRPQSGEIKFK